VAAALRHASHEPQDDIGTIGPNIRGDSRHFAERLLFSHITDTARIEKDNVRGGFGGGEPVAFGDELSRDLLGVALVHLATVGFDVNARHEF